MGCGCAKRMKKLMPKFGYHYSFTRESWLDERGDIVPDSQIDEEHLKLLVRLTGEAARRQMSNIAKL